MSVVTSICSHRLLITRCSASESPGAAVTEGPLTGVAEVLVGVRSVEEPAEWFQRLHDFPNPVDVATPLAFLRSTDDFDAAAEPFALTNAGAWADRRVAWFDADSFRRGLGVRETP